VARRGLVVGHHPGLAYAEQHADRVAALALTAVTTTGPREVEWITRDVGRLFPSQWVRFRDALPEAERDGSIVEAYARLLNAPDQRVREQAARDWCDWEASHVDIDGTQPPPPRFADPKYRMCFARLVTHYWRHAAWRADGELLHNVTRVAHIPATLIHGRLDLSGPPDIAWQLAQVWPAAELHVVAGAGHTSGGAMGDHLVDFLDRFAGSAARVRASAAFPHRRRSRPSP
jgi:proline iminopeptidase